MKLNFNISSMTFLGLMSSYRVMHKKILCKVGLAPIVCAPKTLMLLDWNSNLLVGVLVNASELWMQDFSDPWLEMKSNEKKI